MDKKTLYILTILSIFLLGFTPKYYDTVYKLTIEKEQLAIAKAIIHRIALKYSWLETHLKITTKDSNHFIIFSAYKRTETFTETKKEIVTKIKEKFGKESILVIEEPVIPRFHLMNFWAMGYFYGIFVFVVSVFIKKALRLKKQKIQFTFFNIFFGLVNVIFSLLIVICLGIFFIGHLCFGLSFFFAAMFMGICELLLQLFGGSIQDLFDYCFLFGFILANFVIIKYDYDCDDYFLIHKKIRWEPKKTKDSHLIN